MLFSSTEPIYVYEYECWEVSPLCGTMEGKITSIGVDVKCV
jgi:hypothetical protein